MKKLILALVTFLGIVGTVTALGACKDTGALPSCDFPPPQCVAGKWVCCPTSANACQTGQKVCVKNAQTGAYEWICRGGKKSVETPN